MANLEQSTLSGGPSPWTNAAIAGLDSIKRFVSDWRRRSAFRHEIAQLDHSGNLDSILDDLGLSRWEVDRVVRGYPEADRLLPNMAKRRGIDLDKLEPHTLFELRHTCALCGEHRACRRFLAAEGEEGEAGFCPNRARFDALRGPAQDA